jgi:hypothetical protein
MARPPGKREAIEWLLVGLKDEGKLRIASFVVKLSKSTVGSI